MSSALPAATPPKTSITTDSPGLARLDGAALAALFAGLPAPSEQELLGDYPGQLLAAEGMARLPWPLAGLARRLSARLWRAKAFAPGRGINLWWSPIGWRRRVPYQTAVEYGAGLDSEVLVLDYDIAINPTPLRRVRGELKRFRAGLYLGRMLLRRPGRMPLLVAYFSLEKP